MDHLRQVLRTLQTKRFYANLKKCALYADRQGNLFGFVISSERVSANPEKVKAITEWQQSRMIREIRSFHGLAIFYRRFIRNFSAIMAPIADCLKNENFQWTHAATKAFGEVKKLMTETHVM